MNDNEIRGGLADLADRAERDHEVQMARAELYKTAKYAIKLHDMLKNVSEREGLEGWVQSKITKAGDYMSSVYHHLDYETQFGDGQEAPVTPENMQSYKESLAHKLQEKAASQSQQQAAGIALKHKREGTTPKPGTASAEMMSTSVAELEKIAGTSHEGLPDKVGDK